MTDKPKTWQEVAKAVQDGGRARGMIDIGELWNAVEEMSDVIKDLTLANNKWLEAWIEPLATPRIVDDDFVTKALVEKTKFQCCRTCKRWNRYDDELYGQCVSEAVEEVILELPETYGDFGCNCWQKRDVP